MALAPVTFALPARTFLAQLHASTAACITRKSISAGTAGDRFRRDVYREHLSGGQLTDNAPDSCSIYTLFTQVAGSICTVKAHA